MELYGQPQVGPQLSLLDLCAPLKFFDPTIHMALLTVESSSCYTYGVFKYSRARSGQI